MNRQRSNRNWQVFALTEHDRAVNGHPDPFVQLNAANQKCVINRLQCWIKPVNGSEGNRNGNGNEGHPFELGNQKFWRCIKLKIQGNVEGEPDRGGRGTGRCRGWRAGARTWIVLCVEADASSACQMPMMLFKFFSFSISFFTVLGSANSWHATDNWNSFFLFCLFFFFLFCLVTGYAVSNTRNKKKEKHVGNMSGKIFCTFSEMLGGRSRSRNQNRNWSRNRRRRRIRVGSGPKKSLKMRRMSM